MRRGDWHINEEEFLINNYANMTIKELSEGLNDLLRESQREPRSQDAINAKIKRLKAEGRLEGYKDGHTVFRSLTQRRR